MFISRYYQCIDNIENGKCIEYIMKIHILRQHRYINIDISISNIINAININNEN